MAEEVLFSSDDEPSRVARLVRQGQLRRLATGVYTTDLVHPTEEVFIRVLSFARRYTAAIDFSHTESPGVSSKPPTRSSHRTRRSPEASTWSCRARAPEA